MAISIIDLESTASTDFASYSNKFVKIKRKSDGVQKSMVLTRAQVFQEALTTEQIPKRVHRSTHDDPGPAGRVHTLVQGPALPYGEAITRNVGLSVPAHVRRRSALAGTGSATGSPTTALLTLSRGWLQNLPNVEVIR